MSIEFVFDFFAVGAADGNLSVSASRTVAIRVLAVVTRIPKRRPVFKTGLAPERLQFGVGLQPLARRHEFDQD